MRKTTFFAAGIAFLAMMSATYAADHTLTAPGLQKQGGAVPKAGIDNPGRPADDVPGQGSPLSGEDHVTPATDTLINGTPSGIQNSNPAFLMDKTAPSQNSQNAPPVVP